MQISWHGQYTVKIQSKETTLVIDPYAPSEGLGAFKAKAEIVALSNPSDPAMSHVSGVQGNPTVIKTPGEYALSGFTLYGTSWAGEDGIEKNLQLWVVEDVSVLHLGQLDRLLTDKELQSLEKIGIDILLLPIGGGKGLDQKQATTTLTTIEPRIVIPIHYSLPKLSEKLEKSDAFLKEIGEDVQPQKKLVIKANKLPQDDLEVVVLEP